jgi:hypothetical protein
MKEEQTKIVIGDWLESKGLRIFDERPNRSRPQWGVFQVSNIERGKHPDLVVQGRIKCGTRDKGLSFVAVEVKPCFKHHDVLDGFDAILEYFSDYWWGAEYVIEGELVPIAAFVLATHFSPNGYLFQQECNLSWQVVKKGPWDSYPMTFTIARLLWRQKDNLIKRCQSLVSIPKIEKRTSSRIMTRPIPDVGVLVKHPNPAKKGQTLLMLSENPYHWRFDGCDTN